MSEREELVSQLGEEIVTWAEGHKIDQFLPKFQEAGFDTFEVLCELTESDLDWMEIKAPGQRKKILLAIRDLNASYNQPAEDSQYYEEEEYDSTIGAQDDTSDFQRVIDPSQLSGLQLQNELINGLCAKIAPLLSKGHRAHINEDNPLFTAVSNRNHDEVNRLLQKLRDKSLNVNINELGGDSKSTALHTAVGQGDIKMVRALLSCETIDHTVLDIRGRSVLLTAIAVADPEILELLLEFDAKHSESSDNSNNNNNNSNNNNASAGQKERLLLELDQGNRTMLYLACCANNIEIVKTMLKFIPQQQINRPNQDQEKHTPLFAAVTREDVPLCRLLLSEYGANPNIADAYGTTPLICSVIDHDNVDLVEVLLKYKADPTVTDENGMNALDIAAGLDKKKLVDLLIVCEKDHIKSTREG